MTLKVPSVGEDKLLAFTLGFATPGNQTLKLFVNNITPADADTAATYTEMSTLGYASKSLTKTSWTIAQNGTKSEASYAAQTFSFTAGTAVTVYGYFIIDSTSGVLLWSELFDAPKTVQFAGDQIIVVPKFTLSSEA